MTFAFMLILLIIKYVEAESEELLFIDERTLVILVMLVFSYKIGLEKVKIKSIGNVNYNEIYMNFIFIFIADFNWKSFYR